MSTPMELPPVAQTNSGRMNRHLNKIRDCLRTLHSYEPPPVKRSRGGSTHPWKVTADGSGTVKIHAGEVLGMHLETPGTSSSGVGFGPDSVVLGPAGSYDGSSDNAITGTRYIYAEISRNGPPNYEYCKSETSDSGDTSGEVEVDGQLHQHGGGGYYADDHHHTFQVSSSVRLHDDIDPLAVAETATIVISANAANVHTSTTGKAAICIAKVTNTDGVCAVDKQYITHNPTLFLPVVRNTIEAPDWEDD